MVAPNLCYMKVNKSKGHAFNFRLLSSNISYGFESVKVNRRVESEDHESEHRCAPMHADWPAIIMALGQSSA
jgi:hypothetical protein